MPQAAAAGDGSQRHETSTPVTVAVDANGADLGPGEVAAGAVLAARDGVHVLLFGPRQELEAGLRDFERAEQEEQARPEPRSRPSRIPDPRGLPGRIRDPHGRPGRLRAARFTAPGAPGPGEVEIVDAPVSIAKEADPVRAVRAHPEASIVAAARAVADGRAQALVAGGSTGTALAAGLFNIKRASGVYRPALALPLPVPRHPVTLLDVGANVEVRPEHLVQFAFMGAALVHTILGIAQPRVGLLSNGEEVVRGSALVLEAHAALTERAARSGVLTFVGNVEGDGVTAGVADVVITDGFTGNVALKLIEGVSQTVLGAIRDVAYSSPRTRAGGLLLRTGLQRFRDQIDPEEQGGAYLLGLRRLGVVPHGRFTRRGIARAIVRAGLGAREDVVGRTHAALEAAGALRPPPAGIAPRGAPASAAAAASAAADSGSQPVSETAASVRAR